MKKLVSQCKELFARSCTLNMDKAWKWIAISSIVLLFATQLFDMQVQIKPKFLGAGASETASQQDDQAVIASLQKQILPEQGVVLPVRWGDLGKRMAEAGVIDKARFEELYKDRGGMSLEEQAILSGENNGSLVMTMQNSGFLLNMLWAFGLGNKNAVLEQGPMMQGGREDAARFASTGGWSLAKGDVMNHYSAYPFVTLTQEQQDMVERVSQNIFRPCCGNSTYFPDCNHGMAMLGLIELMASQGVSENDMYAIALQVNSFWFPDTYLTVGRYFAKRDVKWSELNPKDILGSLYSSAQGYQQILQEVQPVPAAGGGGCGI
ncbi:MAG: hypothetical protein HYV78_00555 [Candidatus Wildermuthbacteria bacterium]|nr:hypothetical protein [Candidatus Wildermuthbacteria bacterium]